MWFDTVSRCDRIPVQKNRAPHMREIALLGWHRRKALGSHNPVWARCSWVPGRHSWVQEHCSWVQERCDWVQEHCNWVQEHCNWV